MLRAQTAVIGTAVQYRCGRMGRVGGDTGGFSPAHEGRKFSSLLPYGSLKRAMIWTALAKIHGVFFKTIVCIDKAQADGTQTLGLGKQHISFSCCQVHRIHRCRAVFPSTPPEGRRKDPWEACCHREAVNPMRRQGRGKCVHIPYRRSHAFFP